MKQTMHTALAAIMLVMMATAAWAQGPNSSGTYYSAADGKKGEALKTALYNIIKNPQTTSYDGLIDAYKKTDVRADGYLRDWYSNTTKYTPGSKTGSYQKEGDTYNREHTIPQSWGPPKSDIVHVVPTDGYVNNRRSNYPFGEVGTATYTSNNSYSKLGTSKTAGYSGTVFEPNDEVKGDIARIYFYMATCYENAITEWSGGGFITGTKYQPYVQWMFDMMMRWAKLDPVDDVETARNTACYGVQQNRNPFVDYPGLEDYIWGTKKDQAFSYDHYEGSEPTPVITVAQPVFSPNAGTYTDRVEVSISCATEGATIYYTTNGADASEQSRVYTEPFVLTETSTVRAVAITPDGTKSSQSMATYTIRDSSGEEPVDPGTILLCNAFFGTNYTGSIAKTEADDLVGTQDGVTVAYALGEGGSNRFCNDDHIRLYQKNTLTVSVSEGELLQLEFNLAQTTTKTLSASVGTIADLVWTGQAQSVTFQVDDGAGHMRLSSVKVTTDATQTGITSAAATTFQPEGVYTLSGVRVDSRHLQPGLYIAGGKKFWVR